MRARHGVRVGKPRRTSSTPALVVGLAVALTGALVWHASSAVFSASFGPPLDERTGQSDILVDDDQGAPLFAPSGPVFPGDSGSKCIEVTSTADESGAVRMYLTDLVHSRQGLERHLMVRVEEGTGGTFASCAAFVPEPDGVVIATQSLADAIARFHDYATGAGQWNTVGDATGESRSYRLTWIFDTTGMTPSEAQALVSATTGVGFEWELQGR